MMLTAETMKAIPTKRRTRRGVLRRAWRAHHPPRGARTLSSRVDALLTDPRYPSPPATGPRFPGPRSEACVRSSHDPAHAGGVLRARQPDERARATTATPQAWRAFGAGGPAAAGDPGRLGALVHQRHRGHRDAAAAHDPRLLRLPARSCSTSTTRRPGCPELAEEVAESSSRPGSAPTWTAGASTTAPGRCWCTRSRTPTSRWCSCRSTPTKPFDYHLELGAAARPAARAAACWSSAAATSCTTSAASTAAQPDGGFDWAQRFDDAAPRA